VAVYRLIAGLGNPGESYLHTRHNLGFMVIDCLSQHLAGGGDKTWQKRFGSEVMEGTLAGCKVILFKPMSYMNLSGMPTSQCMAYYKVLPEEVVVVHDDIDLPFGVIRIRKGCGDAGHNGVKSITEALGTVDYVRVRCGIGRPNGKHVPDFVLDRFDLEEEKELEGFIKRGAMAVEALLSMGLTAAQNAFNREV